MNETDVKQAISLNSGETLSPEQTVRLKNAMKEYVDLKYIQAANRDAQNDLLNDLYEDIDKMIAKKTLRKIGNTIFKGDYDRQKSETEETFDIIEMLS